MIKQKCHFLSTFISFPVGVLKVDRKGVVASHAFNAYVELIQNSQTRSMMIFHWLRVKIF